MGAVAPQDSVSRSMTSEAKATFRNIREAFCHRYRCPPEDFERKLFRKSLRLHSWLLMPFLGWFRPHTFNADWSLVETVGRCINAGEIEDRLSEFRDWNLIDRSRRRRWILLRISPACMRATVRPLLKNLDPAAKPAPDDVALRAAPAPSGDMSPTFTPARPSENPGPRLASVRSTGHRQADLEEMVKRLESENAQLREIVAQHAMEIARLRGSGS